MAKWAPPRRPGRSARCGIAGVGWEHRRRAGFTEGPPGVARARRCWWHGSCDARAPHRRTSEAATAPLGEACADSAEASGTAARERHIKGAVPPASAALQRASSLTRQRCESALGAYRRATARRQGVRARARRHSAARSRREVARTPAPPGRRSCAAQGQRVALKAGCPRYEERGRSEVQSGECSTTLPKRGSGLTEWLVKRGGKRGQLAS